MDPSPVQLDPRRTTHARVRAGGLSVAHVSYTREFEQGWHEHPWASVDFVLAGGGAGLYGGREVASLAGDIEYFAPGIRHRFASFETGIRTLHVTFAGETERPPGGEILTRRLDPTRARAHALELLAEIHEPSPDAMLVESLALALREEVQRGATSASGAPAFVREVCARLTEEPGATHSLADLAAAAGVHRAHLARTFRDATGLTVGEYARRARVAAAARLLARTPEPIASVAARLEFTDQAHLTRTFRRVTGTTPGEFRRRLSRK